MIDCPGDAKAQQSEDHYRLLVNAITDYAIYMLSPEGIVTNWNPGAERFKGYSADEIIGEHFSRFYTAQDRAVGLPDRALHIAKTEGKFEAEGWRVRKDGTQFWAHVVIDPIRAPDGGMLGYAKITRDLTERKRAEDSLRQSQEQFRHLVQSVTDYAIYMLDVHGNVSSWNAGAERIKGYAPSEIIGQHFSTFYNEEDRLAGMPATALATAHRDGRYADEGRRVRKDGTEFQASVVIDAVHDDAGHLVGFAKITRDITERSLAELKLGSAREALFQSRKMDALGQLTGGIAHDFNNLLTVILSSLELLNRRLPDDPMARRLLNNAVNGAERGATLTQRLLAFARRQDLALVRVEIPALVIGMSELLQSSLGADWTVNTRFPLNISAVLADVNQLEMALFNLVVNARDAMPNGGQILIETRERVLKDREIGQVVAGRYVGLCVTDDGTGMDAETLTRAMEPFFTTKGIGKGTGLGLSMIDGIAAQLGGAFRLESEPGAGTTAEVWLPAAVAVVEANPADDLMLEPIAAIRPLTILTVDDDPIILTAIAALLEDLGHTVLEASSGLEALDIFRANRKIDLIISDFSMPGMTGTQLAEQASLHRPGIPFLLATGYGEMPAETGVRVTRLGKPFSQRDLAKAVAATIDQIPA